MKGTLTTLFVLIVNFSLYSQLFKKDIASQELFVLGSQQLELGNFKQADSLFSMALCSFKNENIYVNRGIARLCINDTIGFCSDMDIASNKYLDKEAEKMFNIVCCNKVDTFYYDKKMNPVSKEKYKYYEVIQEHKYKKSIVGKIHGVNAVNHIPSFDFGCDQDLLNVKVRPTDIVGMYELVDSVKYFYYADERAIIDFNHIPDYKNMKEQISTFFNQKYPDIKVKNGVNKISIYFHIYISEKGMVTFVKYLGTFPEINLFDKSEEFIADVEKYIKNYPKVTPSVFLKRNVASIALDFVEY